MFGGGAGKLAVTGADGGNGWAAAAAAAAAVGPLEQQQQHVQYGNPCCGTNARPGLDVPLATDKIICLNVPFSSTICWTIWPGGTYKICATLVYCSIWYDDRSRNYRSNQNSQLNKVFKCLGFALQCVLLKLKIHVSV